MLNNDQIIENKNKFLQLISEIDIPGADTQGLVEYLCNSDFFEAPASTQYHCNYAGGLCYHSLNVYNNLQQLCDIYAPGKYEKSSIIAVALLHDISKTNFYEKYVANKKIYSPNGSKHDNQGNFDWFAEEAYKVKDAKDRFLGGEHGFNSLMIANQYIPFTYEESISLLHHHAGLGESKQLIDMSAIMNRYSLVALLHSADFLSTFILEAN